MVRCLALLSLVVLALGSAGASSAALQQRSGDPSPPVTLRSLDGGRYELDIENPNLTHFLSGFEWSPPAGMSITSLSSVIGGKCKLGEGKITCSGRVFPPACTHCAGGTLAVVFKATGFEPKFVKTSYGGYYVSEGWSAGALDVTKMTPLPKPTFDDLPYCEKGHVSTKAHPCAKRP
jgi:hypothetical protein